VKYHKKKKASHSATGRLVVYNSGGITKKIPYATPHLIRTTIKKKSFLINDIATMKRKDLFCLVALVIISAQRKADSRLLSRNNMQFTSISKSDNIRFNSRQDK